MDTSRLIAELDDDAETFGAISAATWFKHRNPIRHRLAQADKLHDALAGLTKMLEHYTYTRENREALARAREVLSQYQPPVEPAPDE